MTIGMMLAVFGGMLVCIQNTFNANVKRRVGAWATTTLVLGLGFLASLVAGLISDGTALFAVTGMETWYWLDATTVLDTNRFKIVVRELHPEARLDCYQYFVCQFGQPIRIVRVRSPYHAFITPPLFFLPMPFHPLPFRQSKQAIDDVLVIDLNQASIHHHLDEQIADRQTHHGTCEQ